MQNKVNDSISQINRILEGQTNTDLISSYINTKIKLLSKKKILSPIHHLILSALKNNPLIGLKELSEEINISIQSISRHLNLLQRNGIISFRSKINYELLNLNQILIFSNNNSLLRSSYLTSKCNIHGLKSWNYYQLSYPKSQFPIVNSVLKQTFKEKYFTILKSENYQNFNCGSNENRIQTNLERFNKSVKEPINLDKNNFLLKKLHLSKRDIMLINSLSINYKQSKTLLAKKLEMFPTSLSSRIRKLIDNNFLTPIIDINKIGFNEYTFLLFDNKIPQNVLEDIFTTPFVSFFRLKSNTLEKEKFLFLLKAPIGTSTLLNYSIAKTQINFESWTGILSDFQEYYLDPNLFKSSSQSWKADRLIIIPEKISQN
ncbi:MAG: winged helix-turn-helix transcriptional regulator [Candidatus Ranarchaeia archaeon]